MPPFTWEDIDHSLVSLRLTVLAEEMRNLLDSDERIIQFENRMNMNSSTVPSLILGMKQKRADEFAQKVYDIYCDVWEKQGRVKSAAFLRAVFARGIRPAIRARANSIAAELLMLATRTNFPSAILNATLAGHRLHMQRLEDRWLRRLEAEAKECEHAERIAMSRIPSPVLQSSPTGSPLLNPPAEGVPDSVQPSATGDRARPSMPTKKAYEDERPRETVINKVRNPQAYTVLSTPEAALYFGVKVRTVHRRRSEGKLRDGARRGSITIESVLKWEKKRSRKASRR